MRRTSLYYVFVFSSFLALSATAQNARWVRMPPPYYGGHMTALGRLGGTVLVATQTGAIYQSSDTGKSWKWRGTLSSASQFASSGTTMIAEGGILYRSADTGATWTKSPPSVSTPDAWGMGANDSSFFVLNSMGVFRSMDHAFTWERVNGISSPQVISVNGSFIFMIVRPEVSASFGGTYASTDNGESWTHIDTMFADRGVLLLTDLDNVLFTSINDGSLYRSKDRGATWDSLRSGLPSYVTAMCADSSFIYALTINNGIYRSNDSGSTWQPVNQSVSGIRRIMSMGSTLFAISHDGVFISVDHGDSWQASTNGLSGIEANAIGSDGKTFFAAMPGGLFGTTSDGATWTPVPGILGTTEVYSLNLRDSVWIATITPHNITDVEILYKSTDGGAQWDSIGYLGAGNLWANKKGLLTVGALQYEPYRSTDDGSTWQWVDPALFNGNGYLSFVLGDSLALARFDSAAKVLKFFISTDFCTSWRTVSLIDSSFNIALDGMAIISGTPTGMYRSRDEGNSWQRIYDNGQFGLLAKNDIIIGVSSTLGVIISQNHGDSWVTINDGLPGFKFTNIAIGKDEIYAQLSSGEFYHTAIPAAVSSEPETKSAVSLYPNPLSFSGVISYYLPESGIVAIRICDVLGRVVSNPVINTFQEIGSHEIPLDVKSLSPGIYTCNFSFGSREEVVKLLVVR
ncbi:MAG: T9SS type A sorting domain-containing protein [Bacteroidota bacterium]|nr:T9SS type A sorting domain-containing protein [Bacteroidota bacterium]MDP4230315.1 T9SS type A sorting domain-containing protein [Bacteroidota bacterium]MDP4237379.1 T9SS type A sorting domain-containing protein [Bacteroidota bacterium]